MKHETYILYLRVSTDRQGRSGLGLEAQQAYAAPYADRIVATYTEIESGKKDDRPELDKALEHCKREGAAILIAKLDRLSRNVAFLFALRDSGVEIEAADMPSMGTLEFGIRAVFAQHEREEISRRTRAALAAKKARGEKWCCPDPRANGSKSAAARRAKGQQASVRAMPIANKLRSLGESYRSIAESLNDAGIPAASGGNWHASSVRNMMENHA